MVSQGPSSVSDTGASIETLATPIGSNNALIYAYATDATLATHISHIVPGI